MNSSRRNTNRHRAGQIIVGVLSGAACLLAAPALASAGTFTALTCHGLTGNAVGTRGWSVGSADGEYIAAPARLGRGEGHRRATPRVPTPIRERPTGEQRRPAGRSARDMPENLSRPLSWAGFHGAYCLSCGERYARHTDVDALCRVYLLGVDRGRAEPTGGKHAAQYA